MGPQIRISVDARFHSSKLVFIGSGMGSDGSWDYHSRPKNTSSRRWHLSFVGDFSSAEELKDNILCIPWGGTRTQPQVYIIFFLTSPLSLHPLPSLISNCLNLPFGTQGRSQRLNEAYFLQTRKGEALFCVQWVKDLALSLQQTGGCCGAGWIPGPGTSTCCGCSQKKKRKKKKETGDTEKLLCPEAPRGPALFQSQKIFKILNSNKKPPHPSQRQTLKYFWYISMKSFYFHSQCLHSFNCSLSTILNLNF